MECKRNRISRQRAIDTHRNIMNRLIVLCSVLVCLARSGLSTTYAGGYGQTGYHGPIAIPVVLKSGYLADTHEVAAARHAHLVAHAEAKARSGHGFDDGGYGGGYGGDDGGYGGGDASYDAGYESGGLGHGGYGGGYYHGPLAIPVVLKSGYIADTHEVAAAKSAHYQALSEASARYHNSGYGDEYYH